MPVASVTEMGRRAKAAARILATASTGAKDAALLAAADVLEERAPEVLAANRADLEAAAAGGMEAGPLDRLRLTDDRIRAMAAGLRQVALLARSGRRGARRLDAARTGSRSSGSGCRSASWRSSTRTARTSPRTPPALCLKSGNAALLRGSGTALQTNLAIAAALREGFAKAGLPEDALVLVDDPSHETAIEVMQLTEYVDCLIPRGGPSLIRSIRENATVPVIIDGDGNCHVYVDADADLDVALDIVVNAKTQRPSVCNAAESLVVHEAVADEFLPRVSEALIAEGVELRG